MTIFTGTIPTIAPGDTTTVSTNLAVYRDAEKALTEAWTTYTHGWTGTLGNGTMVAKYRRLNKTVDWRIQLTWGSTTSHAASVQTFNLPVAPHADYTLYAHMGSGIALDSGTTWNHVGAMWATSTTFVVLSAANTQLTNTVPWTWTTGDKLTIDGTYETA